MKAHQKQSRNQLAEQKRLLQESLWRYRGKLALLQMREEAGIEDADTFRLRDLVRKLKVLLENKGCDL
jgi:hypothetical protein